MLMESRITCNLWSYDDYRRFLTDWFGEQKQLHRRFSHRYLAEKGGFSSSSFFLNVMRGRFSLTEVNVRKVIRILQLPEAAGAFFHSLVIYNQSKSIKEKNKAWEHMQQLRSQQEIFSIQEDASFYFSHWYNPVLRELACHESFQGNYMQLARQLDPAITTEEARQAVQAMVRMGLLVPDGERFRPAHLVIQSNKIAPALLRGIRREYLELAIAALDSKTAEERMLSLSTMAMSREAYLYAVQMLEEAKQKIIARVAQDSKVDQIFELVVTMYPLSRVLAPEGEKS